MGWRLSKEIQEARRQERISIKEAPKREPLKQVWRNQHQNSSVLLFQLFIFSVSFSFFLPIGSLPSCLSTSIKSKINLLRFQRKPHFVSIPSFWLSGRLIAFACWRNNPLLL